MDIYTLMKCHQHAFEYFDGVPQKILYDNMKQVVITNPGDKEKIQYNQQFMDFAQAYGFLWHAM
jgi:transposase